MPGPALAKRPIARVPHVSRIRLPHSPHARPARSCPARVALALPYRGVGGGLCERHWEAMPPALGRCGARAWRHGVLLPRAFEAAGQWRKNETRVRTAKWGEAGVGGCEKSNTMWCRDRRATSSSRRRCTWRSCPLPTPRRCAPLRLCCYSTSTARRVVTCLPS